MSINAQPFSPTFKLVGNLSDSQILVYDASENAFVNATNTGASGGAGKKLSAVARRHAGGRAKAEDPNRLFNPR